MSAHLVTLACGVIGALVGRELAQYPRVRRTVHVALGRPIAYGVKVIDGTLTAPSSASISNVDVRMAPSLDPDVLAKQIAGAIAASSRHSTGIHLDGAS